MSQPSRIQRMTFFVTKKIAPIQAVLTGNVHHNDNQSEQEKSIRSVYSTASSNNNNRKQSKALSTEDAAVAAIVSTLSDEDSLASKILPIWLLIKIWRYGKDPKHSLKFIWVISAILIFITERINRAEGRVNDQVNENVYNGHDKEAKEFLFALLFSIIVSVPIACDCWWSAFVEEIDQNDRDLGRQYALMTISIPNLLIYTKVIPQGVIDLVIFYQFISIFNLIIYQIFNVSSMHKLPIYCSFTQIYCSLITLCIIAFFYNLSEHGTIPGMIYIETIFALFIVIGQLYVCYRIRAWIVLSMRLQGVSENDKSIYITLLIVLGFTVIIGFINLVTMRSNLVFFPVQVESYVFFEWFYIGILLLLSSIRNLEVRKSEVDLLNRLTYNRKMTGAISHEIRTPLNTAFMALDLLLSTITTSRSLQKDTLERDEMLEITNSVKEGCDISLGILNELLTFEKLSAGMMQLEPKLMPVLNMMDNNVLLFKMQAQQKGISFQVDISLEDRQAMSDLYCFVDEYKIGQVARNLLSNAMKFTLKGGRVIVRLRVKKDESFVMPDPPSLLNRRNRIRKSLFGRKSSSESKTGGGNGMPPFNMEGGTIAATSFASAPPRSSFITEGDVEEGKLQNNVEGSLPHGKSSLCPCLWKSEVGIGDKPEGIKKSIKETLSLTNRTLEMNRSTSDKMKSSSNRRQELVFQTIPGAYAYGSATISVIDSGPGIAKEDIHKLFHEFVQINPGELQKGQGSGLGLSISKAIIQLHGGNIWVTSEGRGCGSTFSVELPLYYKSAPLKASSTSDHHPQHNNRSGYGTSNPNSTNHRSNRKGGGLSLPTSLRSAGKGMLSPRGTHQTKELPGNQEMGISMTSAAIVRHGSNSFHRQAPSPQLFASPESTKSSPIAIPPVEEHAVDVEQAERSLTQMLLTSPREEDEDHDHGHDPVNERVAAGELRQVSLGSSMPVKRNSDSSSQAPYRASEENQDSNNSCESDSDSTTLGKQAPRFSTLGNVINSFANTSQSQEKRIITFLVVDDSTANRKMLARLLTREGHQVLESDDGTGAVDIIKKQIRQNVNDELSGKLSQRSHATSLIADPQIPRIDVILMDCLMTKMNGPQAARKIRKLGFTGPIVGVTGLVDEESDEFIKRGADVVLCKPVNLPAIWKALRSIEFV